MFNTKRLLAFFIFLALLSTSLIQSHSPSYNETEDSVHGFTLRDSSLKVDSDYIKALNAANRFLIAWLNRDVLEGTKYITKNLKNSTTMEDLSAFFQGQSNPHHHGFEILGIKRSKQNKIVFQVWLFEHYTGDNGSNVNVPSAMMIDVIKVGDSWLVNSFPKPNP
jgi:hypothetical protein